jgi:hypothetical protein
MNCGGTQPEGESKKTRISFWWGNVNNSDRMKCLYIDGRIILKCNLNLGIGGLWLRKSQEKVLKECASPSINLASFVGLFAYLLATCLLCPV